jgi:hypothetical protein
MRPGHQIKSYFAGGDEELPKLLVQRRLDLRAGTRDYGWHANTVRGWWGVRTLTCFMTAAYVRA